LKEKVEVFGGKPIMVPIEWGKAATSVQLEGAVVGHDLKAIAVVYNETSTGITMRGLKEFGTIARKHDALYIVDAISILGGDELPTDSWGVDLCVTGSQKCLACPPGLALISVSERAWQAIEATKSRAYYFNLLEMREFQKRSETPFTPALSLFFALDEALAMLREEGPENRIKRHRRCAQDFYSGIEGLELELFADERWRSSTVIAVKNPAGIADKDIRDLMRESYGVVIAGGMGKLKGAMFRIGNMGIISEREVEATLEALKGALSQLGHFK